MIEPVPMPAPTSSTWAVLRDTTFRSLKHRDYRLYFFGQIVSFTGTWMQSAALMWLVWDATDDPAWPPRLLVASVGPTLLFGTWGGAIADRVPKRWLIFRTQIGFLGTALALAILTITNQVNPWYLFSVQLVNGLIQSVDLPTRLAFVPDLVPRQDLINAVSLNSLLFNSARAIGPAMAGGLFVLAENLITFGGLTGVRSVTLGAGACFILNAISFVAVLMALQRIHATGEPLRAASDAPEEPRSFWTGLRYIFARPKLAALLALTGVLSVFGWPVLSLLPAYTRLVHNLGEKEYSLLVSGLGAGALIGALITATFGSTARRGLFLTLGAGLGATGMAGLTAAGTMPMAVIAASCLGFGLVLFLSTGQSALQLSATDDVRGRVMALWAMTLSASAPLGHLLAGELAKANGVTPVMAGMTLGVAVVAMAVAIVALTRGWQVDQPTIVEDAKETERIPSH